MCTILQILRHDLNTSLLICGRHRSGHSPTCLQVELFTQVQLMHHMTLVGIAYLAVRMESPRLTLFYVV